MQEKEPVIIGGVEHASTKLTLFKIIISGYHEDN